MSKAILNRLTPVYSFAPSQPTQYAYIKLSKSLNGYRVWHFKRLFSTSYRGDHVVRNLLAEVEREKQRERDQRKRAGLGTADIDAEDDEDYMRVGPLIAKLEKENQKHVDPRILNMREEATDSESEEDDHRFTHEAIKERQEVLRKKLRRREELLQNYTNSENIDDAFKWMHKIDKFEEKHLPLRPEYRVIGDLMNRLKEATGKEKFLLQHKINRAIRLVKWKEAYDPDNPANYGVIQKIERTNYDRDRAEDYDAEKDTTLIKGASDDEDDEEFDVMKERDNLLTEKVNAIDRKLEEKLIQLDYTFGKKGIELEEEIRDLAEERNSVIEKKKIPLFRKGFDVKLIDLHKTTKVTKGGRRVKFSVMVVCGNFHGVIGFAKAKDDNISKACHKAHAKCFQNLHYVERHEDHTIAHAIQASYKKTKVYLWPGPTQGGMKASNTVQTILNLAGLKNVKSKIVGPRQPHNTVKAVFQGLNAIVGPRQPHNTVKAIFQGLNAIETPKDVQEKFGRVVVESYLL
ncbi:ribosomal protein S5 family protein [Artemisia annua]|uniref:Ribosomal protein S5 family protein n=1 Tax=Artemisia annua TaxID=35608 RepID=A0A2U1PMU1_ARTAN|nr:ribosomal protein S5 family protein [Artemisia annua]